MPKCFWENSSMYLWIHIVCDPLQREIENQDLELKKKEQQQQLEWEWKNPKNAVSNILSTKTKFKCLCIYFSFKRLIKLNGTSIFGSLSDKLLHAFGPLHSSHAYFFLQCARLVPLLSAPARFLFWLCALMTNCMRLSWSVPDLDFLARFCASCAWAGGEIGGVSTVRWQQRQRFFGGSSF